MKRKLNLPENLHILNVLPVSGLSAENLLSPTDHIKRHLAAMTDAAIANAFNAGVEVKNETYFHIALIRGGWFNGNKLNGGKLLVKLKAKSSREAMNTAYMQGTAWGQFESEVLPKLQEVLRVAIMNSPLLLDEEGKTTEHFILLVAFSQEK